MSRSLSTVNKETVRMRGEEVKPLPWQWHTHSLPQQNYPGIIETRSSARSPVLLPTRFIPNALFQPIHSLLTHRNSHVIAWADVAKLTALYLSAVSVGSTASFPPGTLFFLLLISLFLSLSLNLFSLPSLPMPSPSPPSLSLVSSGLWYLWLGARHSLWCSLAAETESVPNDSLVPI